MLEYPICSLASHHCFVNTFRNSLIDFKLIDFKGFFIWSSLSANTQRTPFTLDDCKGRTGEGVGLHPVEGCQEFTAVLIADLGKNVVSVAALGNCQRTKG